MNELDEAIARAYFGWDGTLCAGWFETDHSDFDRTSSCVECGRYWGTLSPDERQRARAVTSAIPWGRAPTHFPDKTVKPFSSDIACAWAVVGALIARGYSVRLCHHERWQAQLLNTKVRRRWHEALAETAPEALCRAALDAHDEGAS